MFAAALLLASAAVDRAAASYLSDRCRVGLSIVVRERGHTRFHNYGSVRRDAAIPPRSDSVYELASVTKSFTGALAAKTLVDRRMALDADFRTYLADPYPNLEKSGRPITLRSLATHTSGLQRDLPDSDALMAQPDFDHIGDQLAALNRGFGDSRSLAALHSVTLRTVPGNSFAYSNIGIRLIGYGLERVYRTSYASLLRRDVTGPLGMTETRLDLTPAMRARLVVPYSRYRHTQPYHDASAGAAYGLWSTPRDMARYLAWQLDERDPVVVRAHGLIHGTNTDGQGMIWNIGREGADRMLWHGGGTFGMTSQMVLYPDSREGYVLLANDACAGSESALKAIASTLHNRPH